MVGAFTVVRVHVTGVVLSLPSVAVRVDTMRVPGEVVAATIAEVKFGVEAVTLPRGLVVMFGKGGVLNGNELLPGGVTACAMQRSTETSAASIVALIASTRSRHRREREKRQKQERGIYIEKRRRRIFE